MMVGDTHPSSCFDGYGYGRGLLEGADCAISNIGVGPGGRPMMEKFKERPNMPFGSRLGGS